MFSGADKTFYTRFGGIRPLTPGYKTFQIKPNIPEGLTYVNSYVNSIYGLITSDWKIFGDVYANYIEIPVNTTARIYIPAKDPDKIFERGKPVSEVKTIQLVKSEGKYQVFNVGSGIYLFSYGKPVNSGFIKK